MTEGKQSKASKLYAAATTAIREKYRSEFDALLADLYQQSGMTYTKRKTAEEREAEKQAAELEKARKQIAALQEKHPELQVLPISSDPAQEPDL